MTPAQPRIGIDLGGTKIEIIVLSLTGDIMLRQRILTPPGGYTPVVNAITELVKRVEDQLGTTGSVGIATPGTYSRASGLMKNANSTYLNGQPLLQDLEHALGRPLRMANDANCFALSEAIDGAATGAQVVFGVILGTGVGGGIVVNRQPLVGPNGIAGEWGHNPLPDLRDTDLPLPQCYCGRAGCIELFLSGPGLARDHHRNYGDRCNAEQIVTRARQGDSACSLSMDRYLDRLARGLGSVINVLDPEVIVLGGGLSNIDTIYTEVPGRWQEYVFSDRIDTRLVKHRHGDSSGVRGAAWLWSSA